VLRQIKLSDLEAAIMALSLNNSVRLLKLLVAIMKKGFDIELTVRCSILLLKNHWKYILSNNVSNNNTEESVLADIEALHQDGMLLMNQYRELVGVNLQGLKYLSQLQIDKSAMKESSVDDDLGISAASTYDEYLEKRSELVGGGGNKKKRKQSKGTAAGHENNAKKSK
jgi:hypothetical protein